MHRRTALVGTATAVTALVAGCTGGGDESDGEPSDDENESGDGNGEDLAPDAVADREQGENVIEYGDLGITDHELVLEEGEYEDQGWIECTVENTSSEPYDYVEVGVRFYDADGTEIGTNKDRVTSLGGGSTESFELRFMGDAADVEEYDIGVTGERHE